MELEFFSLKDTCEKFLRFQDGKKGLLLARKVENLDLVSPLTFLAFKCDSFKSFWEQINCKVRKNYVNQSSLDLNPLFNS